MLDRVGSFFALKLGFGLGNANNSISPLLCLLNNLFAAEFCVVGRGTDYFVGALVSPSKPGFKLLTVFLCFGVSFCRGFLAFVKRFLTLVKNILYRFKEQLFY